MNGLEDLVASTLLAHADEAPDGAAMLIAVQRRMRRRRVISWSAATLTAAAVVVAVTVMALVLSAKPDPRRQASSQELIVSQTTVVGDPAAGQLVVGPPANDALSRVSESDARSAMTHHVDGWPLASPARFLGLALVTAKGGLLMWNSSPADDPATRTLDGRLAWVAVGEIDHQHVTPHCPMAPQGTNAETQAPLPPLLAHYYSAVLVDAATGQVITWEQDISGLATRACLGIPTS